MSVLSTVLPSVAGQVVNSNSPTPAGRPDGGTAQAQQVTQSVNSGAASAAVVSLSRSGKRGASYGDGKQVDASFEKQEAKSHDEKKKDKDEAADGSSARGKTVNVSA